MFFLHFTFWPRFFLQQGSYSFLNKKIQGLFKDTFPIFQGLHSVQERALTLCLFQFFHDMGNFILKVFLCLLLFVEFYLNYEVSIDEHLTYEVHFDKLCIKLSKRLGLLRHISPYLKKNQRIIYFNAVIKPLMMYASTVWASCNKEVLERVLRMQKRAARIILEAQRTSRTVTLFNNLSWIPFYNEGYCIFIFLEGHKLISNV